MTEPTTVDRWFLSDCEGRLAILLESALRHVTRDDTGEIVGYCLPEVIGPGVVIAEWDLDTWDPGSDEDDDERRRIAAEMVRDHNERAELLGEVDRLRSELISVVREWERQRDRADKAVAERDQARADLFEVREEKDDVDTEATVWHDEFQQAMADVERLRAELAAAEQARDNALSGEATAEAKRDQARDELAQARDELARVRADLEGWRRAATSTDLEGDVGDHLCDLADWQTANGDAPDWLVKAVLDLLAPVATERDRLAKERAAIARADKAGERWARQTIDGLTGKIHRVREVHAPQCGGACAAIPCECQPADLVCAECETSAPCATIRALDGEEDGRG